MIAARKSLSLFDHSAGEIHGINAIYMLNQTTAYVTSTTSHVKYLSRLICNELQENFKDFWWMRRSEMINLDKTLILEMRCILTFKLFRFGYH